MEDLTASKILLFLYENVTRCFKVKGFEHFGNNFHHQFDYILIVNVSHGEVSQTVSFQIILDACSFNSNCTHG